MALISPGVEVQVIDESFYTPAEPGTVPLIVVTTAENKLNGAGTGVASGTLAANAGKVFRVTSQRELVELYGSPFFEKTASGSPVHGGERNEYGLLAAYSLLGVSNSAFIVRANVDLNDLQGTTEEPGSAPANGAWWLDTQTTKWGIQEWNGAAASVAGGQKFTAKTPIVLTDTDDAKLVPSVTPARPRDSVGVIGDYAVVVYQADDDLIRVWYKSAGNGGIAGGGTAVSQGEWVLVGSQEWMASHPTVKGTATVTTTITGAVDINGQNISFSGRTLAQVVTDINSANIQGVNAQAINGRLYMYSDGVTSNTGDSTSANSILLETPSVGSIGNVLTGLGLSLGEFYGPELQQTPHTSVPQWKSSNATPRPTGSVWIKTTEPNNGARVRVRRYNSSTGAWPQVSAPIYASGHAALYYLDRSGGGLNLPTDTLYVQSNADEQNTDNDVSPDTATFKIFRRTSSGATVITSNVIVTSTFAAGNNTFTVRQSLRGELSLVSAALTFNKLTSANFGADEFAAAINNADFGFDGNGDPYPNLLTAEVTADNKVRISHTLGGEIRFMDGTGTPVADIFTAYDFTTGLGNINFYDAPVGSGDDYVASNWKPLVSEAYQAGVDAPLNMPADGQLWYNPAFGEVDIMVHDGSTWVGYQNEFGTTDPEGPIVSATMPEEQSDGSALVANDLWISTADLENFPKIYRFTPDAGTTLMEKWVLLDKTDQTTEEGVLFADARWGLSGAATEAATILDLLTSDYLDPDAPDPDLYPKGMLLWNLRRSGGNVKRYKRNYIDTSLDNERFNNGESMINYFEDRWVTASPNQEDGSGSFGRKAQRAVVVAAMKSAIDTSEEARDEERRNFNLIAAPGYPECLSNLVNLNLDRKVTAFVVGDTPLRLRADATSLTTWGTNANLALDNNDNGIVTYDEYSAVWYPNGFTTDLSGVNAVVPASHMMLRTIALSDQVSYPWFAPAGTRRGGITNATAVGYIDSMEGEFVSVALNNGQRDTLYDLKVNPIPFFNGVGLVAYGQKTRARNASALDRINVARLVVYLRVQLTKLARPYIFEPNDQVTRDEIKQAVESLLIELVGLRAIYDFAVVCDETNNTPARIDRNELYVDVAIEPTKAVEFIYIPLRLKNTGEI